MSETATNLSTAKPLTSRSVLITRASAQAGEFAFELEQFGARVIACPSIEIVAPDSYEALDEAIRNLFGYDWLIFTSVNGVDHFLRRLENFGLEIGELDTVRVCAIGAATARKLEESHVHVDLVPEQFSAEGIFTALETYLGGRDSLSGLNFLIPRAAVARDYLPHALEEAGARVDVVTAYRTVVPNTPDLAHINTLLAGGGIDCIAFTSSSTVRNFAQLFDTHDLSQLLAGVVVACIGEITAQTVAEFGLQADIMPSEFTIPALARAIAVHFSR